MINECVNQTHSERLPHFRFVKYTAGLPGVPIIIDALHHVAPDKATVNKITQQQKVEPDRLCAVQNDLLLKYEFKTRELAEAIAQCTGAGLVLATESRLGVDLNRPKGKSRFYADGVEFHSLNNSGPARKELREVFMMAGSSRDKPLLRLSVHGMRKRGNNVDIFIAGGDDDPSFRPILLFFRGSLENRLNGGDLTKKRVIVEMAQDGIKGTQQIDGSLAQHSEFRRRLGVQTVQIEVSEEFRLDLEKMDFLAINAAEALKSTAIRFFNF